VLDGQRGFGVWPYLTGEGCSPPTVFVDPTLCVAHPRLRVNLHHYGRAPDHCAMSGPGV